ncbi:aldo/keto reductase [Kibdelosporangium phytohabitans]|uniref:Aldo/keto reductase n=1 Tax=Kibdelosporangium phytohabitans TaxID=860235 RepID=A0A0N9I635_9PSEU|nr:aldo/keto reductase [Kibdelosporangium phytohabitans]ALG14344.1 aldo/keto reductase [Kibdelosporangium phytohabitans]MBE1466631.1 aryl-alcohol dehydrogenase-like predicted oxidoreductase [Kibdelosporangium phytohabitans]
MKRVQLGEQTVSQVALGCMSMGTLADKPTSSRILDAYLDAGGDFLDTADCYSWWNSDTSEGGESEQILGELLKGRRDKVFLATKVSALLADYAAARETGDAEPYFVGAGADVIRRGIDDSLRRLQTDHVDLYYIHVDDMATPLEETLQALDEIVRAGKVRHVGWSNVWTWRLERIRALARANGWAVPIVAQQQFTYLDPVRSRRNVAAADMLAWLEHNPDVTLAAYAPILQGSYEEGGRAKSIYKQYDSPEADAKLAALGKVARELGVTASQVVLAWLLQVSNQVAPIVGPRTWEHYEAYARSFDLELAPEHVALLDVAQ